MDNLDTFSFNIDEVNKRITIRRRYLAPLETLWKAWTRADILDMWWGPKPWRAETRSHEFREGGDWLYAMVSPEGEKHWSKSTYLHIEDGRSFTSRDGFCDENGVLNPQFPQNSWETQFSGVENGTQIEMILTFDSSEDLQMNIAMGFEEGITQSLHQLEDILKQL